MGMAGLWETWRSPAGERIRSFTIITTTPNELRAELHNRMPVVLKPQAWPLWLGEQPAEVPQLKALLAPYPSEDMICWPVSARVGNVKNNDPSLIEPIAASCGVCSGFVIPACSRNSAGDSAPLTRGAAGLPEWIRPQLTALVDK